MALFNHMIRWGFLVCFWFGFVFKQGHNSTGVHLILSPSRVSPRAVDSCMATN